MYLVIFGDNIGLTHIIASVLALIFGTLILILKKGTYIHRKIGYAYVLSMLVLLVTSFMIYRLFNGFGIFHYSAIISSITLVFGLLPILLKRPKQNYLFFHFTFMYWSVIGLYCAFASEILTRIGETPFFKTLGITTFVIILIAVYFYIKKQESWRKVG